MEGLKIYSKKSFGIITIFVLLISALLNAGLYLGIDWLLLYFSKATGDEFAVRTLSWAVSHLDLIFNHFYLWVVPAVTGFFLLVGYLLWGLLRLSISTVFKDVQAEKHQNLSKGKFKNDFVDQKIEQERKQRLFLHSLSVLQRDGRLLDFFDEDLSLYNDEQIGAAVRSVQEDCKKTLKKYIDPKPVLENEEGETITIETGFDMDSIKLVGNVSGEPPFEGILKHRGWKAGKKEIPKLSDIQDAAIIVPAEVEIQ